MFGAAISLRSFHYGETAYDRSDELQALATVFLQESGRLRSPLV